MTNRGYLHQDRHKAGNMTKARTCIGDSEAVKNLGDSHQDGHGDRTGAKTKAEGKDHNDTKRDWYDFFLVSQQEGQGTVSPTHYNMVHDNTGLKPDIIQKTSYKLTHMYYNWPGIVRVPAPCQYTHKLAYKGGEHIHKVTYQDDHRTGAMTKAEDKDHTRVFEKTKGRGQGPHRQQEGQVRILPGIATRGPGHSVPHPLHCGARQHRPQGATTKTKDKDHTVTRRDWYDFFLVPQHEGQGTVSPTHYIVVHDNTGLKPNIIQRSATS